MCVHTQERKLWDGDAGGSAFAIRGSPSGSGSGGSSSNNGGSSSSPSSGGAGGAARARSTVDDFAKVRGFLHRSQGTAEGAGSSLLGHSQPCGSGMLALVKAACRCYMCSSGIPNGAHGPLVSLLVPRVFVWSLRCTLVAESGLMPLSHPLLPDCGLHNALPAEPLPSALYASPHNLPSLCPPSTHARTHAQRRRTRRMRGWPLAPWRV